MENASMVQIIQIFGECHIIPSALLISNLITFPPRIHWEA